MYHLKQWQCRSLTLLHDMYCIGAFSRGDKSVPSVVQVLVPNFGYGLVHCKNITLSVCNAEFHYEEHALPLI